ncbi:MAG: hypothetical protein ACLRQF_06780 [Thomasclavelia ramosa]
MKVLIQNNESLIETNDEQCAGYGLDKYCLEATRLLKRQLQNDNVDIHYLVGEHN